MEKKRLISDINTGKVLISLSGLVLGILMASADYHVNLLVASCLVLTVLFLQIFTSVIPGIICAVAAVWMSYGTVFHLEALMTLLLGYFVYRLVHNHSVEDSLFRNGIVVTLTSLLVYGFLPIYGAYFVCAHSFGTYMLFLPALSIGSLCLAAVNSEYLADKSTRVFHSVWIVAGIALMTAYAIMRIFDPWHFCYLATVPVFILWLIYIWKNGGNTKYPAYLYPALVMTFAVVAGAGFAVYLF